MYISFIQVWKSFSESLLPHRRHQRLQLQLAHSCLFVLLYSYDANVSFVNKELKPRIEEVRRILAEKYFDKWPKYMHLATTLTDGASARISAINASMRVFRPDCLHAWQLKSFWHEYPFITGSKGEADVEFHEFESVTHTHSHATRVCRAVTVLSFSMLVFALYLCAAGNWR